MQIDTLSSASRPRFIRPTAVVTRRGSRLRAGLRIRSRCRISSDVRPRTRFIAVDVAARIGIRAPRAMIIDSRIRIRSADMAIVGAAVMPRIRSGSARAVRSVFPAVVSRLRRHVRRILSPRIAPLVMRAGCRFRAGSGTRIGSRSRVARSRCGRGARARVMRLTRRRPHARRGRRRRRRLRIAENVLQNVFQGFRLDRLGGPHERQGDARGEGRHGNAFFDGCLHHFHSFLSRSGR